ncbi:MAG: hypothetical protein E7437_02100 [Ruminococcaceae bacterium]|nr:hypothetical protein [Oscillospiraceae bacterium]
MANNYVYSKRNGDIPETMNLVLEKLAQIALEDAHKTRQSTGFLAIDKLTTGLADEDLVVIASRPAMGKTAFALDIAKHLAKEISKTTVLFSLEMSKEQIVRRLQRASGNEHNIEGNLVICDDPWLTVKKIHDICESVENLGAIIIDYFNLLDDLAYHTNIKDRFSRAYNSKSRGLKLLARELSVPVICTAQLGRQVDCREDNRPVFSDLNNYGALQQDADQILLLYRDCYYNSETPLGDIAECIVAKNRHGDCGTVRLLWDPEKVTFSDEEVVE